MIEKWCYFFKNVPESPYEDIHQLICQESTIKKAFYVLDQYNWTEQELLSYEKEEKRIKDNQAVEEYKSENSIY